MGHAKAVGPPRSVHNAWHGMHRIVMDKPCMMPIFFSSVRCVLTLLLVLFQFYYFSWCVSFLISRGVHPIVQAASVTPKTICLRSLCSFPARFRWNFKNTHHCVISHLADCNNWNSRNQTEIHLFGSAFCSHFSFFLCRWPMDDVHWNIAACPFRSCRMNFYSFLLNRSMHRTKRTRRDKTKYCDESFVTIEVRTPARGCGSMILTESVVHVNEGKNHANKKSFQTIHTMRRDTHCDRLSPRISPAQSTRTCNKQLAPYTHNNIYIICNKW